MALGVEALDDSLTNIWWCGESLIWPCRDEQGAVALEVVPMSGSAVGRGDGDRGTWPSPLARPFVYGLVEANECQW